MQESRLSESAPRIKKSGSTRLNVHGHNVSHSPGSDAFAVLREDFEPDRTSFAVNTDTLRTNAGANVTHTATMSAPEDERTRQHQVFFNAHGLQVIARDVRSGFFNCETCWLSCAGCAVLTNDGTADSATAQTFEDAVDA